ncbi:MAG: DUF202 domain-containing protein [Ignavibacteria bacterium]|nr:DUF202 domain-containing protein [Ignavibacteria bacterium]
MFTKINIFGQIFQNKDEIILRDYLALERTNLANQRTLLAYTRTSLYMLLGGIAFLQLSEFENIKWLGLVAIGLSAVLVVVGIIKFFIIKRRLETYYSKTRTESSQN